MTNFERKIINEALTSIEIVNTAIHNGNEIDHGEVLAARERLTGILLDDEIETLYTD